MHNQREIACSVDLWVSYTRNHFGAGILRHHRKFPVFICIIAKGGRVRKVKYIDFTLNTAIEDLKMCHNSQQTSNQQNFKNRISKHIGQIDKKLVN